jgi:hypothetical protein
MSKKIKQIIDVLLYIKNHYKGYDITTTRRDADKFVARKYGINERTVVDKYRRQLKDKHGNDLGTQNFDYLLKKWLTSDDQELKNTILKYCDDEKDKLVVLNFFGDAKDVLIEEPKTKGEEELKKKGDVSLYGAKEGTRAFDIDQIVKRKVDVGEELVAEDIQEETGYPYWTCEGRLYNLRKAGHIAQYTGKRRKKAAGIRPSPNDELIELVIDEIAPGGPKKFPNDFLSDEQTNDYFEVELPGTLLDIDPLFKSIITSSKQYFKYQARNPAEAKYIVYSHRIGLKKIIIPQHNFVLFKAVTDYEKHCREMKEKAFELFLEFTNDEHQAELLTQQVIKRLELKGV